MLINDAKKDMEKLSASRGTKPYVVGVKLFGSNGAADKISRSHNISRGYESLVEQLGYDIEFEYEERLPAEKYYLNDLKKDIDMLCWWRRTNLYRLAKERGGHPSNLYQALDKDIVTRRYYEFCKELGYGIRLKYIPREEK